MIIEATDFRARFDAVQFVMGTARPDLPQDRLDDIALTYALNAPFSAIEEEDYSTSPRRRIVSGPQNAPIFRYMQDGALIGALMCSCRSELYPTRVQGIAVRRSHWGTGVSTELIGTAVDEERILGGAPRDHNARRMCERVGLAHWVTGASGATLCFSDPIRSDPIRSDHARRSGMSFLLLARLNWKKGGSFSARRVESAAQNFLRVLNLC